MRSFQVDQELRAPGFAIVFDGQSVRKVKGGLSEEPMTYWTSPATGARYPIEHRLVLREIATSIVIRPVHTEQEIPVFGAPAIWEGAVTAHGQIEGQGVEGWGRLELYGYGYADTIARYSIRHLRRLVASTYRDLRDSILGNGGNSEPR